MEKACGTLRTDSQGGQMLIYLVGVFRKLTKIEGNKIGLKVKPFEIVTLKLEI